VIDTRCLTEYSRKKKLQVVEQIVAKLPVHGSPQEIADAAVLIGQWIYDRQPPLLIDGGDALV